MMDKTIHFKEDRMMKIDLLKRYVSEETWDKADLRSLKETLVKLSQQKLKDFSPMKKESYSDNPIQLIDFFCGAGGTSLGFAAINEIVPAFNFLGGCDINKASADSYAHNYGTPIINCDIRELAQDKKRLIEFLDRIGYDSSKPTILIGCAPCQGFTSHRKKHWNEEDDIRNNLVNVFAEIVSYIQPVAFVMENVPEFLSNRYWRYLVLEILSGKNVQICGNNLAAIWSGLQLLGFCISLEINVKKNFETL